VAGVPRRGKDGGRPRGTCVRCGDAAVSPFDPNGLLYDYCLWVTERERDR